MKIIMTLLVRDEADILDENIKYHLSQGVDYVIATDNLSVDGTKEILDKYRKQGVLSYSLEDNDIFDQHTWVTRMARFAKTKFNADWVINNDADEFWWPEKGNLKSTLETLPSKVKAVSVNRSNFLPLAFDYPDCFYKQMIYREAYSINCLSRPLPGKVCHRAISDIHVANGNHSVSINSETLETNDAPIIIFHFPMRSYKQFENKIVKGVTALERNKKISSNVAGTWRMLYSLWQNGQLKNYYKSQMINPIELEGYLVSGEIILDDRLKEYMSKFERML